MISTPSLLPARRTFEADRLQLIERLEASHFWFVARRRLVHQLLHRYAGNGDARSVVVDLGCGTGSLAAELARPGSRVLALDLREEGLIRLKATGVAVLAARSDVLELPVSSEAVDLVLALDVLEHTDDDRSLAEVSRILKPGGTVVLTVPAMPSLWSARDEEAGHRRRYTRRSLVGLVRRAGLELLDMRFYQCLLLPLVVATRVAGRAWPSAQRVEETPVGWLNRACLAVSGFEVAAGEYVRWPCGSSLAAVARKPSP